MKNISPFNNAEKILTSPKLRVYNSLMPKKLSEISNRLRQEHILAIVQQAAKDGISVPQIHQKLLARKIEVTQKTIRRDLDDLSFDYEITHTNSRPARFIFQGVKSIATMELNRTEVQTLAIAIAALATSSHEVFHESLSRLEKTILNSIDVNQVLFYEQARSQYVFLNSSGRPKGGNLRELETILYALRRKRIFKARYESPYKKGSERARSFEPLRLVINAGIPYLDAWDTAKNAIRRLRLTRLSAVKLTDATVNDQHRKELPSSDELFGAYHNQNENPLQVALTGDEVIGHYFNEKTLHSSQQVKKEGRNFVVTFKIAPSSEFTRLLASLAPHLSAIKPASLRNEVLQILDKGLQKLKAQT